MTVTVLETMTPDELSEYREFAGRIQGIQYSGRDSSMSVQEIQDFFVRYWQFTADLMERYGVEGYEAEEAKFSVYTGHIYIGSEE